MSSENIASLSASADGNYRQWLSQLQERFQRYLKLAADPTTAAAPPSEQQQPSAASNASNKNISDNALLQMTRREIEVLAAYHCELQRLINDQNLRIEAANTDLQETNDLAERLQLELERRHGAGISPRRQAKNQLRTEIAAMRRHIDELHQSLLGVQGELETARAEHADVRSFISKQFFPVARVAPDQKWKDHNKPSGGGGTSATSEQQKPTSFSHGGKEFVVRATKAAELREALIAERRSGVVPGTTIKSSTFDLFKGKELSSEEAADQKLQADLAKQARAYRDSASRMKHLPPDGPLTHQLGPKAFTLKKVGAKAARSTRGVGATAQLSQERHARASAERAPFRAPSLASTTETQGIMTHHDPVNYEG